MACVIKASAPALLLSCVQVFSGLLIGAMLPYWFSAMTMKSVGKAALAMVEEVRRQFSTISGLMEGTARPDYRRCVEISTAVRIVLSQCIWLLQYTCMVCQPNALTSGMQCLMKSI